MVLIGNRELFNATHEGLFIHDESGGIVDVNERACALYGYAYADLLLCQLEDLCQGGPPFSPIEASAWVQKGLEAPPAFEWHAKRRCGELFWVEITLRACQFEGNRRLLASVRDITAHKQSQKALQDSEFLLRRSQSMARVGSYALDLTTGQWVSSGTLDEIFGIDDSFPKNVESWGSLVHLADRAEMLDYFHNYVFGQGQHFDKEYRIVRQLDGVQRWVHGIGDLELGGDGRPLRMIGTIQDITRQVLANQALVESERRFRHLLQHSADVITVLDRQGMRTYQSGPVEQVFGYSTEELLGKNALASIIDEDRQRVQQVLQGVPPGSVGRAEYRVRHKEGHLVYLEAVGTNLLDDPATQGIVLNVRDITERRRAELALQEKEERYRLVSELSGQLIQDYDVATGQTRWAGRVEEFTGYSAEEFNRLGLAGWETLIHPEEQARTLLLLDEARSRQTPFSAHYRLRRKNGDYINVAHEGAFLYDEFGNALRLLGSIKDETRHVQSEKEQAKLQEQLHHSAKMEALGRLAGGIAHDFNNLLTVISGNLELTQLELSESDPVLPNLEEIMKATQSAAALTCQLLAFSRRQVFEPRVLCLNELVDNLHKMLARVIGEHVVLQIRLASDLAPVRFDPNQFEHVLVNLAVNARDAMPAGGRLLIETSNVDLDEHYCAKHPTLAAGAYICLAVSDTGQGISDTDREHLFEPFYTTKAVGKGTGLGLSIILGIVQQSAGTIEVYSELGQGTTFKIYLPQVAELAEKLGRENSTGALATGSETVLLVEDDAKVRELTQVMLVRLGYRVFSASDGNEALLLVDRLGTVDLMLTDVVMPGMNGRELAKQLHGRYPDLKVLFTSGYAEGLFDSIDVQTEDIHFIGKPYTLHSLANKLREVLEDRRHPR